MSETRGQSDALEQRAGRLERGHTFRGRGTEFERQQDVLERRQVRQQLERLEHEADLRATQLRATVLVAREQVVAEHADSAGGRRVESRQQSEQGRLARTRRARDCDGLAACDGEVDIIENHQAAGRVLYDFRQPLRLQGMFLT